MARYSVELRDIIKSGVNIFNFNYEFYDPNKKADFETKFINHFYFREIGVETVGKFMHYLKCKCDETLPYYNMLFRTALIDYQKTINYSLTETLTREFNKEDKTTGTMKSDGTKSDNTTITNVADGTRSNTLNNDKTNTLNSKTDHTDTNNFTKTSSTEETGNNHNSITVDVDNKNVESDTPSGLLSMSNIKNNVYASKANIQDNLTTTNDVLSTSANKTLTDTEKTTNTTTDTINGTTQDKTVETNTETTHESNTGMNNNNGSFNNNTNTSQNTTGVENETTTRTTTGSYGVITEADMLQKHIALQQTLTTILTKFFDECEDLFMQIF